MHSNFHLSVLSGIFAALCFGVMAADTPLGNMTAFKQIADDTLKLVEKDDLKAAKVRIKDLEMAWDNSEVNLKQINVTSWSAVDKAIDLALKDLRSSKPKAESCLKSLNALIVKLDAVHRK